MPRLDPPFEIVQRAEDGALVIAVSGELDLQSAPGLRDCIHAAVASGQTKLVVDAAGLQFMDSTGISVLVDGLKQSERAGGRLVLRAPTPGTRRVLEIAGLLDLLGVE